MNLQAPVLKDDLLRVTRGSVVGQDRHFASYFVFRCAPGLFCCSDAGGKFFGNKLFPHVFLRTRLTFCFLPEWTVFKTQEEVEALKASLNVCGVRESALSAALV